MANNTYDVVIVGGLGHIGLPLGLVFADSGLQVGLYDINTHHAAMVREGKMPFVEHEADQILARVNGSTLHVEDTIDCVARAGIIVITIGTPLDRYMNPRVDPLLSLCQSMIQHLRPDQLVVLRSTVLPGTTELLDQIFKRDLSIDLAFCPERVVQGSMIDELRQLPQIISGTNSSAVARSRALFERLGAECIETTPKEAELAKLFCNAWRYISFAIANQFYMLSDSAGADFHRVQQAMTYRYKRMENFPSPGFTAGPCLMKDTMQLAAYTRHGFELGRSAMFVNEGLAAFAVEKLVDLFGGSLVGRRVGILGMSFKAGSDDIRDSLSYKIRKLLIAQGADVRCTDEYVSIDPTLFALPDTLDWSEGLIVGVPHVAYRGLVPKMGAHIVDVWGILAKPLKP